MSRLSFFGGFDLFFLTRYICVFVALLLTQPAWAEVAVLANRTVAGVTVEVIEAGKMAESLTIPAGDSKPVFFKRPLQIRFGEGIRRQQYALQASSAYYFTQGIEGQSLQFEQIGLGEQKHKTPVNTLVPNLRPQVFSKHDVPSQPVTVTVQILVDDNEPTHRRIWEPKLRNRIAEASAILERHSGIRLKVTQVSTWESDDKQKHFHQTMREFEREVRPHPAQVAIGFSSQYQATRGRSHLGGTRGPLHSHILLRERSRRMLEVERLELLVHELGHYLGASHSPEPQSVMRPVLDRGPQRTVGARIQFDPVNALLIALTGEEMRHHGVRKTADFSQPTAKRMKQIYGILQQAMPQDPSARQYISIFNRAAARQRVANAPKRTTSPLVRDTSVILNHLLRVAQRQAADSKELSNDELTNLYVRQAAQAAGRLRSANAPRAFLLALGIFMDDTETLRALPVVGDFIRKVEPTAQRNERLEVMGKPSMRDRNDLTKHFFVSAHMVVVGGKGATASAGLAKERKDANGGTGFSFVDMAANHAGIVFAERLLADKLQLKDLTQEFYVDDFLPTLVGLEEGLTAVDLQIQYGNAGQPTVASTISEIEQRVLNLPVYDLPED